MMKKTLMALAVAATFVVPAQAAEVSGEVTGDFRLGLGYFDSNSNPGIAAATNSDLDVDNNNSVIGAKVSTTEGNITASLVYERLLDNDAAGVDFDRQAYLSIATPYGTGIYGRAPTAYKTSGQKLDPFYNTQLSGIAGAAAGGVNGAGYGLSALTNDGIGNGFVNNTLAYVSPSIGGLTINAAIFTDEGAGVGEDHDLGLGVEWSGMGITAGVQLLDINSGNPLAAGSVANFGTIGVAAPLTATRLYGSFADGSKWGAGVSVESLDLKAGATDRLYAMASGWLSVMEGTRVAVSLGNTNETPFEGNSVSAGVFHDVIKNLTVNGGVRFTDRAVNGVSGVNSTDVTAIALGVNYKFSVGGSRKI